MKKILIIMTACTLLLAGCSISNQQDVSGMVSDIQEEEMSEEKNEEDEYANTEELAEEVNTEVTEITPNYYHSVSDADAASVYLGGVGGIYRIDSESEVQTVYSAPHIVGAALYGDYVFSLEYIVTDNGMTVALIRINTDDSAKEVVTQVNSGSYDLKIIDNMLILSEEILGDYGIETVYQAYTLDDNGNLTSEIPQDVYAQFVLPDDEEGMRLLIDPWFSTKYFDYVCFIKGIGVMDINSVWIRKENEESAEEIVACVGMPLVGKDKIFYCDSDGKTLLQHSLDNSQETVLYEIPDDDDLLLLTYDAEWVYFRQKAELDEYNELPSFIMRVNLQDHRTEEIYELQPGSAINNFNVYDNNCYFILSDTEGPDGWICCNLNDLSIVEIHSLIK